MMLICLDDVKMMLEFFRSHVDTIRGVQVLLERMEDVESLQADTSQNDFKGIN